MDVAFFLDSLEELTFICPLLEALLVLSVWFSHIQIILAACYPLENLAGSNLVDYTSVALCVFPSLFRCMYFCSLYILRGTKSNRSF